MSIYKKIEINDIVFVYNKIIYNLHFNRQTHLMFLSNFTVQLEKKILNKAK